LQLVPNMISCMTSYGICLHGAYVLSLDSK
jgi:hypothetical protein